MIHPVRVIFADTDQMGVVYYANYLRYFEASRAAYLRALGRSHVDLEAWGISLPVIEAHCNYRRPAHYEELLDIEVDIVELRAASMRFAYRVTFDGVLLADGYTWHACVGKNGRPRRIPAELKVLIARGGRTP